MTEVEMDAQSTIETYGHYASYNPAVVCSTLQPSRMVLQRLPPAMPGVKVVEIGVRANSSCNAVVAEYMVNLYSRSRMIHLRNGERVDAA